MLGPSSRPLASARPSRRQSRATWCQARTTIYPRALRRPVGGRRETLVRLDQITRPRTVVFEDVDGCHHPGTAQSIRHPRPGIEERETQRGQQSPRRSRTTNPCLESTRTSTSGSPWWRSQGGVPPSGLWSRSSPCPLGSRAPLRRSSFPGPHRALCSGPVCRSSSRPRYSRQLPDRPCRGIRRGCRWRSLMRRVRSGSAARFRIATFSGSPIPFRSES